MEGLGVRVWGSVQTTDGGIITYPDEVNPIVGHRLAALTDGEGCFHIARAHCEFIVKMRADDRPFLEGMRELLGSPGAITQGNLSASGGLGNRKPYVQWQIRKRREVAWLTEVFDAFPLWSKKARDYEVWREAAIAWYAGAGHAELAVFAEQLREVRKYRELTTAATEDVPSS